MKIDLQNYGTSLVSRELAKNIFSSHKLEGGKIILNFLGVSIVTPSFSHELLSNILENSNVITSVEFLNTNSSVELQLKKALSSIKKEKEAVQSSEN